MIEVEKTQRLFALEDPASLAMKWNQRRCRVEQAAEMRADSRPSTVDAAVEARTVEDLARTEAVARFKDNAPFLPGRGEHRPQPRLREFEIGEFAFEPDRLQRTEHRQGAGKVGGGKEDEPGVAGRQGDSYLDVIAFEARDRCTGFL